MKRLWHGIEDGAILAALGLGPLVWGGLDIGIETLAAAESEARRTVALAITFSLMTVGCLARLARPSFQQVFLDPLCGTGTIPIELGLGWRGVRVFCGDIDNDALRATVACGMRRASHWPLTGGMQPVFQSPRVGWMRS